jgi:hypothetical protein
MFTGKHPPRPPLGVHVGRRQGRVNDVVEQLSRIQGAFGTTWTPMGPFFAQSPTTWRLGQTTSSGIPMASGGVLGQGTVNDYYLAPTNPTTVSIAVSPGGTSFTAFNLSTNQDVPASVTVICMVIWGQWVVVWADCPS